MVSILAAKFANPALAEQNEDLSCFFDKHFVALMENRFTKNVQS